MHTDELNIGISAKHREEVAKGLAKLLADTYTLYLKTHNYHWNVTGPHFNSLHAMFEAHYTELATAVDEIAERIRALGMNAPGSYREFADLTDVADAQKNISAMEMVKDLALSHETTVRTARTMIESVSHANDEVTADLLTQRMQIHEKTAWMLRSLLD